MDRRLTPANARIAHLSLRGQIDAPAYVEGTPHLIAQPCTDLCAAPDGPRDRQLQLGERVLLLDQHQGWSFIQRPRDNYVGYVTDAALAPDATPTHFVATPATHVYAEETFKSPDLMRLGFGARVTVTAERRKFWETPLGFLPKSHLRPLDRPFSDPVTVAQMHFGVPYLWGGNSTLGIDCSGLVQAALWACDIPCPGDSDQQETALGTPANPPQRGDLFFWKGHVAMAVDDQTLIHANAHHMATAYEPIDKAIKRIEAQGDGPLTAHKRL